MKRQGVRASRFTVILPVALMALPAALVLAAEARKPSGIPEPTVVLKPGEVPAVVFAEPVYDFGRARAGEKIEHNFVFSNTGNGPLEILKVQTG